MCLVFGGLNGCADLDGVVASGERYKCTDSSECIDGFACGPSSTEPDVSVCQPNCLNHTDCDAGELCTPVGTCLKTDANGCSLVEGELENTSLLVGSITPLSLPGYADRQLAIQLAVREFNDAGGIRNGRRIVQIGCDSQGDRDAGIRVTTHLANLGAPAVVGPFFSGVFIDSVTQVAATRDVFMISPSATSALITNLDDKGLGWRTISADDIQAAALADLAIEKANGHILLLAKDDAYGGGLLSDIGTVLSVELGSAAYTPTNYSDGDLDPAAFVSSVYRADANLVVLLGTSEIPQLIEAYDARAATDGVEPIYLVSEGAKVVPLLEMLTAHPEITTRVKGTDPAVQNGEVFAAFEARFRAAFSTDVQIFAANAYDAMFVTLLAMNAVDSTLGLGGGLIAGQMQRLITGEPIQVGPNGIGPARNTLDQGQSVNLEGASGNLDFDLTSGDVDSGVTQWGVVQTTSGLRFETERSYDSRLRWTE